MSDDPVVPDIPVIPPISLDPPGDGDVATDVNTPTVQEAPTPAAPVDPPVVLPPLPLSDKSKEDVAPEPKRTGPLAEEIPVQPDSPPKLGTMILFIAVLITAIGGGIGVFLSFTMRQEQKPIIVTSVVTPTSVPSTVASIKLATEYSNPFDATTQYTNPFSEEQNPFDQLQ